jgi:hypothetical protein
MVSAPNAIEAINSNTVGIGLRMRAIDDVQRDEFKGLRGVSRLVDRGTAFSDRR